MFNLENRDLADDAHMFGIVNISVANLRQEPVYQSELVNQTILGTLVPIYEEQNDFYYIRNWDNYLGWVSKQSICRVDRGGAGRWLQAEQIVFPKNYGFVSESESEDSDHLTDLVEGSRLKKIKGGLQHTTAELPDGRIGFVANDLLVNEELEPEGKCDPNKLVQVAKRFLGVPYLWGGTSSKAFDCSGFVQTAYRLLGLALPRNSSQMAEAGVPVEIDENLESIRIGDLLFFGKTEKRITHVAIAVGDGLFIHSDGFVRINSFDPNHPKYNEYRHGTLLRARRVFDRTGK